MGSDHVVRLACVDLGVYRVIAAVVAEILTRRGYRTELSLGMHDEIYPALGAGAFHLFTAAWLPSANARQWRRHGRDLERWAALYEGARFFLALGPDTLPAVTCLGDLGVHADRVDPFVRALTPRASLTRYARAAVQAYRLDEAGLSVAVATPAEWRRAIDRALAGEPVVLALWTPLFTDALPLRPLADPLRAFGTPDTAFLLAHRSAREVIDAETTGLLQGLRFTCEAVSSMDRDVTLGGASPLSVARRFTAGLQ